MDIRTPPLKRGDLGLAGTLIVVAQILSSYQEASSVNSEIRDLREDIQAIRSDHDRFFVRKESINSIDEKIEKINGQLSQIKKQIKSIRSDYSFIFDDSEILGCNHMKSGDYLSAPEFDRI